MIAADRTLGAPVTRRARRAASPRPARERGLLVGKGVLSTERVVGWHRMTLPEDEAESPAF